MTRRYKKGNEPFYDAEIVYARTASKLLTNFQGDYDVSQFSVGELDAFLKEYEKQFEKDVEHLKELKENVKKGAQVYFNKHGIKQIESHFDKERRFKLEVRVDVCVMEINVIIDAQKVAVKHQKDKTTNQRPIMPRGPVGHAHVSGLTSIGHVDFQLVEPVNGLPVIIDKRSEYNGMSIADYAKHIVGPWRTGCRKLTDETHKKLIEEGKQKEMRRTHSISWPKWPVGVKNHLNGQVKKKMPIGGAKKKKTLKE